MPAPVPVWAAVALAGGLAYLLFGQKANAAQKPVAKTPTPKAPPASPPIVFKKEEPIFKQETPANVKPLEIKKELDVTNPASGAIQVATSPTGAAVMQRPDGSLVTVAPTTEVVGTAKAFGKLPLSPDKGDGKRSNEAYYRWAQVALNNYTIAGKKDVPVDGKNSEAYKAAVKVYQKANSLSVDGIVGKDTEASLFNKSGGTLPPPPWAEGLV